MIYLLPGMGADRRMYPPPWSSLPDCTFIDWPEYFAEQTLSEVAAKIISCYPIDRDSWLVGSSLGGMVACEITKQVQVRGLFLIGSARSAGEINALLRLLSPLIDLAPLAFVQQLAGNAPTDLMQMFKDSDPAFIRAMCHAIIRWDGLPHTATPLHRIHGRNDLVIPLPEKIDRVLDGGHLIAMTHAADCVDYVQRIVSR